MCRRITSGLVKSPLSNILSVLSSEARTLKTGKGENPPELLSLAEPSKAVLQSLLWQSQQPVLADFSEMLHQRALPPAAPELSPPILPEPRAPRQ